MLASIFFLLFSGGEQLSVGTVSDALVRHTTSALAARLHIAIKFSISLLEPEREKTILIVGHTAFVNTRARVEIVFGKKAADASPPTRTEQNQKKRKKK